MMEAEVILSGEAQIGNVLGDGSGPESIDTAYVAVVWCAGALSVTVRPATDDSATAPAQAVRSLAAFVLSGGLRDIQIELRKQRSDSAGSLAS